MSNRGRGRSRGQRIWQAPQAEQSSHQLPHAQPSMGDETLRKPGQSPMGGRGMSRVGGTGDTAVAQIGRGVEKMSFTSEGSGDASTGTADVASGISTMSTGRGASRGKRVLSMDIMTKPSHVVSKKGISGKHIILQANYFKLLTKTDWCIYQYHVDFAPEEDRTFMRKILLRLHKEKLGAYIFDGTVLYTSNRLPEKMELLSTRQSDNVHIKIDVRIVGSVMQGDPHYIQFFNIIMRKCLDFLNLQLIGRNYFDAKQKVSLPEQRLELWPGYITSIRQHEHDILMCAEIAHKVMRHDTLLDILNDCYKYDSRTFKRNFVANVVGTIVFTDYNNRTYRVEDIDFDISPEAKFPKKDGTMISYMEYYQSKYGLRIKNRSQPLILTRNKPKDRQADKGEVVYLVPELCRATGLTDTMRENFSIMKKLSEYTRVQPDKRIKKLMAFNNRLNNEPNVVKEFANWNMKLDSNLLQIPARDLGPEKIIFGANASCMPRDGDWTMPMQNKQCLAAKELRNWVFITTERDKRIAQGFVDTLMKVSRGISFRVEQPNLMIISDDRPSSYSEFLERILSKQVPQLVFCVVSNNRADRYSAIKKKCCVDRPIPSQVYLQRNLTHRTLMSVATKVAIQINCKLGGAPWRVEIPLDGLMVIGYDVCHETTNKGKNYGAMVATLDRDFTKYFSTTDLHERNEELSASFSANVYKAIEAYRAVNNSLPMRILIYRDGVGEGQVQQVLDHEVTVIRNQLTKIYGNENHKLAFIVVTKRLNTRLFWNDQNPPVGTVVDDIITSPIKYDFFLVSQKVKSGAIMPTAYSIIHDSFGLDADKMQRLTYKLTHLYFNCSTTVRVPAPCHYAHKLAFLVSKYIHHSPHNNLQKSLFFL